MGLLRWVTVRRRTMALLLFTNILLFMLLLIGLTFFTADDVHPNMDKNHEILFHQQYFEENIFSDEDVVVKTRPVREQRTHSSTKTSDLGTCEKLKPPAEQSMTDKRFRRVSKGSRETYVFSAFFDDRKPKQPVIRIIGLSKGDFPVKYCQVWYRDDDTCYVYVAEYNLVPETHERKYAPSLHECKVQKTEPPLAVSLVNNKCEKPVHALKVHDTSAGRHRPRYNFTVCVTPINFHFDRYHQLIETIEVNRMFGASKFVFYNHTTGPNVDIVLQYYYKRGVADVIQWKIPLQVDTWPRQPDVEPEIHYFGQLVAAHDCLYRYMFTSKYIVFTDLDEVIVPRMHTTWPLMIRSLSCPPATSSYIFCNTFFRMDWPDDKKTSASSAISRLRLSTLLKLRREVNIWPAYSRSKVIVKPKAIVQLGVHFVYSYVDGFLANECEVAHHQGLLHHYRAWEDEDAGVAGMDDRRMTNFSKKIISRTSSIHKALKSHLL